MTSASLTTLWHQPEARSRNQVVKEIVLREDPGVHAVVIVFVFREFCRTRDRASADRRLVLKTGLGLILIVSPLVAPVDCNLDGIPSFLPSGPAVLRRNLCPAVRCRTRSKRLWHRERRRSATDRQPGCGESANDAGRLASPEQSRSAFPRILDGALQHAGPLGPRVRRRARTVRSSGS